ncbi:MAG: hypothetical protein ACFCVD_19755 [Nodosilinea sp.]
MVLRPDLAAALFLPAGLGLLAQVLQPHPLPHRILALALMLISVEQATMARVDLRQIALVERGLTLHAHGQDANLARFRRVVIATIGGELAGFYLAATGYLGGGVLVILTSLVGFNVAAGVRLDPAAAEPIQPAGMGSRLDVLAIDGVAMGLGILWIAHLARGWVAGGLLALVLVYAASKLMTYGANWLKEGGWFFPGYRQE